MRQTYALFYLFFFTSIVKAILVNVTVDDALPDPLTGQAIAYLPESAWNQGATCSVCSAAIDGKSMHGGTWHDGTYFPETTGGPLNATFRFNGTAIYVYCALGLETTGALNAYTNMTFYIDGKLVGGLERVPPGTDGFTYNVPVFSSTSLSPGDHEFVLQNGQFGNRGNESLVLFDYLVYSYDNGEVPSSLASTSSTGSLLTRTSGASTNAVTSKPAATSNSVSTSPNSGSSNLAKVGGVISGMMGLAFVLLMI